MVREALTGYWSLVSGLTDVTLERARTAARQLAAQGDATREQVAGLAQEIVDTGRANREALVKLIRYETERAAGRLGFASSDEVTSLQGRVRELERSIADLRAAADRAGSPAEPAPAKAAAKSPAKEAPARAAKAAKAAKTGTPPAKKAPAKAARTAKAAKATPRARTAARTGATGPGSES